MKKSVFGRKLKRDKNERKALFKSLMSALVLGERIKTTQAKAKAIKPEVEKLVTKAKKGGNAAKLVIEKSLTRPAYEKLIKEIGPRFAKRAGGYTRIIKLGERFGDNSPVVLIEWTESAQAIVPVQSEEKSSSVSSEAKAMAVKKASKGQAKPKARKLSTAKKSNQAKSRKAGAK
jgi:large subunit ribosomal protein L17